MSFSTLLSALAILVLCSYVLEALIFAFRYPKEPLYIRPTIPLIGHLLGFIKTGVSYYDSIEAAYPDLKIFALPIISFKCYIVRDYELCAPIQRAAKTISYTPFAKKGVKLLKNSHSTIARSRDLFSDDPATREFARDFQHVTAANLAQGAALNRVSLSTASVSLKIIDQMVSKCFSGPVEIDLYEWVRHTSIMAVTTGIYGPTNPYLDPLHFKNFRILQDNLGAVASGIGRLFAGKTYRALEGMWQAYESYYQAGGLEQAADVLRERARVCLENNTSPTDVATSHASFDIALLSNYVPTSFWVLYDIISRPELLSDIRKEVGKAVVESQDVGTECCLDISLLRTSCPLLVSSMQETQRLRTCNAATREIIADTTIGKGNEQYILKKGNYLQLHGPPILRNTNLWGEDAQSFDPRRFIRMSQGNGQDHAEVVSPHQLPLQMFPVWGFGPHLCPARYYAFLNMMLTVALVVIKLDIKPAGDLRWTEPKSRITLVSGVVQPKEPVRVMVSARNAKDRWDIVMRTPDTRLKFSVP